MEENKANKKVLEGVVNKISSTNTIAVRVERKYPHTKYGRIVKSHKKYLVHIDNDIKLEVGDQVLITEMKPVSKRKSWKLLNKIEKK